MCSSKHVISPVITRSQTTAAAAAAAANLSTFEDRTSRRLDFLGGGASARSPTDRSSRSSSGGYPSSDASVKSRQHGRTSSSLSDLSAVSATAANILYSPTVDETIVNTFLILLLNALGTHYPAATAEWSINRMAMKHTFGASALEARTDGCL
ncbi:hypothetical protein GX50_07158 [[Emmonsia] crescens]|uniref:Uncharacterized protein n=1 Tax=[Emmonsia] crescens TaxID=73230 RepID=A0A2B7Z840_9EURO|nr:hypothetical protein GX50_07158 [Emmonsia crescens]